MLPFQPPEFGKFAINTALGQMVYYRPIPQSPLDGNPPAATPLVFLHSLGIGSSAYEWSKVYPAFAARYPIFAPDLVGWGASAHPPHTYQVDDYLRMLGEFLEQVTASPAVLIASSLTAAIALRFAVDCPKRVQGLVLVCPSGYADGDTNYSEGIMAQLSRLAGVNRLLYTLGAANELAIRTVMQNLLFASPARVTQEMVAAYLASAQQPEAEYAAIASLRGDLCFDLTPWIKQLTVPTSMVWGEQAKLASPMVGQRLAALNPKAIQGLDVIAATGSMPQLEQPEQVISLLNHYLHQGLAPFPCA